MFCRIKAGALQLVLFVASVIALLLTAFVLIVHTNTLLLKKTDSIIQVMRSTERFLELSLTNQDDEILNLQLPEDHINTTSTLQPWGVFNIATATSSFKDFAFTKIAMTGHRQIEPIALYLADNNKPLYLSGNSQIKGNAFLPEKELKTDAPQPFYFYGKNPHIGNKYSSTSEIPALDPVKMNYLRQVLDENPVSFESFNANSLTNSFTKPTLVLNGDELNLDKNRITGNVIIKGSGTILIPPTAHLKDVLVTAPRVVIQDDVRGSFQVIASKSIIVGRDCYLQYPSSLIVVNDNLDTYQQKSLYDVRSKYDTANIYVDNNSIIKGLIFYAGTPSSYRPQIKIEINSKVVGQVYCEQTLELSGANVIGNVTTNYFRAVVNIPYTNFLVESQIDITQLPPGFVGFAPEAYSKKGIVKWLY